MQNSLAAIAVAYEMRIAESVIQKGFAGFGGVKRRFSRTGEANGVTVIDDYGHHPVEIAAVLKAARQAIQGQATQGKVIAVVQPHRYTRLANLFEEFCTCFNDADVVLAADVYPAGEQPIEGVSGEALGGRACARAAIAMSSISRTRRSWRKSWHRSRRQGISSSASAPAASPIGRKPCRPSCRRSTANQELGHESGHGTR